MFGVKILCYVMIVTLKINCEQIKNLRSSSEKLNMFLSQLGGENVAHY